MLKKIQKIYKLATVWVSLKSRIGEAFLFAIKLQAKTAKQNAEIPIPTMLIKTRLLLLCLSIIGLRRIVQNYKIPSFFF